MKIIDIKKNIEKILDNNKATNIASINLKNKSYIADYMIIASGTSSRHLQALSEILVNELKKIEPMLTSDVIKVFDLKYSVNSKKSFGGTSFANIKKMITKYKKN